MRRRLGCILVVVLSAATQYANAQVTRRVASAPLVRHVHIAPNVQLEVLDWGGHGQPLVFLAGLGNTAHVFDGFAPQFTDGFHVVGITRRGFGASSGALPPNNIDTLVSDIHSTLDSLGLARVVLIGHSIAGEEMTRFGEVNSGRCAGLVYMDAAYDRASFPAFFKAHPAPPAAPPMRASDSTSASAVRAYTMRRWATAWPESEILATSRFDTRGRFVGGVTPDSLIGRIYDAVKTPHYDRVQCRSLAIYGVPNSAVDLTPYYAELDSAGRAQADSAFTPIKELANNSYVHFSQSGRNEVVKLSGSRHYVFLDRPTEVARAIRGFLGKGR